MSEGHGSFEMKLQKLQITIIKATVNASFKELDTNTDINLKTKMKKQDLMTTPQKHRNTKVTALKRRLRQEKPVSRGWWIDPAEFL